MNNIKKHPNIDRTLKKQKTRSFDLSEYKIHCQIAQYLELVIKRPSRWHTVEVSNHSFGRAAMINQAMDKKKGVRTGWPDIEIILMQSGYDWPCSVIFLEIKIPGGKLTEKQAALHKELKEDGHEVHVAHSVEEVQLILKNLRVV